LSRCSVELRNTKPNNALGRVANVEGAAGHFVTMGASIRTPVRDVGDAIRVATITDPFGNTIGLIENPHFELPKQ
jgi:predicted enzyme related to lactoylglutathione lyase